MFIGLEAMPLNQQIEQSHGIAKMRLEIVPASMRQVFEVTDLRQHGEHGFDEHAHVPFAAFTQTQVGGMPVFLLPAHVGEDNHVVDKLLGYGLKG